MSTITPMHASFLFGTELIVISVMLLINAVFAAFEMALASISHGRLTSLARHNKRGAAAALRMKEKMEASLAVVQIGITLVGAIAAATGGAGVRDTLQPYLQTRFEFSPLVAEATALILFVLPLSIVTTIFGELIPKMAGLNHRESICLLLAPFMEQLANGISPLVRLLERITKIAVDTISYFFGSKKQSESEQMAWHELHAAVGMARTARLIGANEEKILLSAAQLSVRPLKEIIIPLKEISMLHIDSSLTNALLQAHLDLHTRFPVCQVADDPMTIEGYVTFKDIVVTLKMNPASPSLRSIVRPIRHLPAHVPIAQALETMIHEKIHIALVDGPNELLGMVTLEDILEELVGSIEDEFDRLPNYTHATEAGWIVGGGLPLSQLSQLTNRPDLAAHGPLSIAQWCVKQLNRPVQKGEIITAEGLTVIVRKLRRHQVAEAFVRLAEAAPSDIPAKNR